MSRKTAIRVSNKDYAHLLEGMREAIANGELDGMMCPSVADAMAKKLGFPVAANTIRSMIHDHGLDWPRPSVGKVSNHEVTARLQKLELEVAGWAVLLAEVEARLSRHLQGGPPE